MQSAPRVPSPQTATLAICILAGLTTASIRMPVLLALVPTSSLTFPPILLLSILLTSILFKERFKFPEVPFEKLVLSFQFNWSMVTRSVS